MQGLARFSARLSIADAYALIALAFGFFFLIVMPPFGTGDETAHFERSYEIATGQFLGAEGLPAGMQAFIDDAFGQVRSRELITINDFVRWSKIPLDQNHIIPYPEPLRAALRIHSPASYPHIAPLTFVGLALGARPFYVFYLGRLGALIAGIALVRAAIARSPASLRPPMAFVGLLPTTLVFFTGLNIESLLIGLSFYFFATIADLSSTPDQQIRRTDIILLAVLAVMLSQFKAVYSLVPIISLLLPSSKFGSGREKVLALALIIVPGFCAGLAWGLVVRSEILDGILYSTTGENRVAPSEQIEFIFRHPAAFAAVIVRTLFLTQFVGVMWKSMLALGGWTNIPVSIPSYVVMTEAFLFVWASGPKPPAALISKPAIALQLAVFCVTTLAMMTLLYVQWTGVGAPLVEGFQGRYWLSIMPLLFAAAPVRWSLFEDPRHRITMALAAPVFGLVDMARAVIGFFYR
jgi:hypothetical protein